MSKNCIDKYMKLIKKMEHWNDILKENKMPPKRGKGYPNSKWDYVESYYFEKNVIYCRFIKDIATGKINNMDDIIILSKLLNNTVVKTEIDNAVIDAFNY